MTREYVTELGLASRAGRARRRGERGSVLIIALLVILALTALGLVGLRQSAFELNSSSNSRYAAQAYHISNAALIAYAEQVGANGQAYWNFLTDLRKFNVNKDIDEQNVSLQEALATNAIGISADRDALFGAASLFRPAGATCSSSTGIGPFTADCTGFQENNRDYNFAVRVEEPRDGLRVAGFSGNFCFKRFKFTSRAWVGPLAELPATTESEQDLVERGDSATLSLDDPSALATRGHVTYANVGPLDCTQGYYSN